MKKTKKPDFVHTLFGFNLDSIDDTGWVRLADSRFEVVPDREDATEFRIDDPGSIVDFVNSELPSWKFHAVKGFPLSAVNPRNA